VDVLLGKPPSFISQCNKIDKKVLLVIMLALFWQSLISFTTTTIAVYAIVLGIVSYILLVNQLCRLHGAGSDFSKALKGHTKAM
jgi:hypothetical protein